MISFGPGGEQFYCFTRDAVNAGYHILCLKKEKVKEGGEFVEKLLVKEYFTNCVGLVGRLEVFLKHPISAVDFSANEKPQVIQIAAGLQEFELLSIELPQPSGGTLFLQVVVLPGTIYGLMLSGLEKATADYEKCRKFWADRSQLHLPLDMEEKIVPFPMRKQG